MRKSLKKIMTFALSAAMAVTGMSGTSFASAATKTNEGGAVMLHQQTRLRRLTIHHHIQTFQQVR